MVNSVKINPDKLQRLIDKSGKTCQEISLGIHYGKNYIAAAKNRKTISVEAVQSLKQLFNFNPRSYVAADDVDKTLKRPRKSKSKAMTTDSKSSQDNLCALLRTINFAITAYLENVEKEENKWQK